MSAIDDYLKDVGIAQRVELERIRAIAHEILPGAEEAITYGMPTIKYKGKSIIGFASRAKHIGIYPFSGRILKQIPELDRYAQSKGALKETLDNLLPEQLIKKIIEVRLSQASN
jgi:uncharacterized protein YdhG (YjbR/CyaY superfamily)